MWPYKLFRIGAGVLVLFGILHLVGHLGSQSQPPLNGTEATMKELMYGYKVNMMGTMRSTGEIVDGFSLAMAIFPALLGALAFVSPVSRKIAIVYASGLAVLTVISVVYWFAAPTVFLAGALACFAGSALLNR